MLSILVLREIPTCKKTNENERQNSFIVFPFWCVFMPFGCFFPLLCVHVSFRYVFTCGVFFCDYHVCPISFLRRLFVQMTCALDLGFVRKPMKMKDKILSIVFPSWCVFMPFGCVFPLLCVHVFFRYVFTCGVFSVIIMCVQLPFCDVYLCR